MEEGDFPQPSVAVAASRDDEHAASVPGDDPSFKDNLEHVRIPEMSSSADESANLPMAVSNAKGVTPIVSTEQIAEDTRLRVNPMDMANVSLHESDSAVDLSTVDSWKLVMNQAKERMTKSSGNSSEPDSLLIAAEEVFGAPSVHENHPSLDRKGDKSEAPVASSHSDCALTQGDVAKGDAADMPLVDAGAASPTDDHTTKMSDLSDPQEANAEIGTKVPVLPSASTVTYNDPESLESLDKDKSSIAIDTVSQLAERAATSQHPPAVPSDSEMSTEYDDKTTEADDTNNETGGPSQVVPEEQGAGPSHVASPLANLLDTKPHQAESTDPSPCMKLTAESSATLTEATTPQALLSDTDASETTRNKSDVPPTPIVASPLGEREACVPQQHLVVSLPAEAPQKTGDSESPIPLVDVSSVFVGVLPSQPSEDLKLPPEDAEDSAALVEPEQQVAVSQSTGESLSVPVSEDHVRKISTETVVASNLLPEGENTRMPDVTPPSTLKEDGQNPEEVPKKESTPVKPQSTSEATASTGPSTQVGEKKKEEFSMRSSSNTMPSSSGSEEAPTFIQKSHEKHPSSPSPSGTVSLADSSITDASPNADFAFKPAFTPNASIFRRQNCSPSNLVNYKRKPLRDLLRRDLHSPDEAVVERALQQITIDCFYDESARSLIARTGGLLSIIGAMEDHPENARIQIAACQALEKLALDSENERAVSELGGIDCILGAMMSHFDNIRVQESSWSALQNLTCGNALTEMTFDSTDGGMTMLVRAFEQHASNSGVAMHASATLANLCIPNAERTEHVVAADGIVALAKALQQHWSDDVARCEISHSLERLCESISSRPAADEDDLAASARF